MKSSEGDGKGLEEKAVLLREEGWDSAERGTLEDALDAFLPFRNIPYRAQLEARSKELDQTLGQLFTRAEDTFAKDEIYAKKPAIKKPPLEEIIPTIPNVGYERNVTLGLEKVSTGEIHVGIRVLYEKCGNKKHFLLPLSECSNVALQIVKAAEAITASIAENKFNVYDGMKNCGDIYGLKFFMNEIGEIILSLVLAVDDNSLKEILKEEDCEQKSDVAENAKAVNSKASQNSEEVRITYFVPRSLNRQTLVLKKDANSEIETCMEEYARALREFVEKNRSEFAIVGAYITWHDAKSPPEQETAAPPWFRVAGCQDYKETVNSMKHDIFPHLANFHLPRMHTISNIMKTLIDGLSLQKQSSIVLLISKYYIVPSIVSQKCKQVAVLGETLGFLRSYLKDKCDHENGIRFHYSADERRTSAFLSGSERPTTVVHWGQFLKRRLIQQIVELRQHKRPVKIAWVIDTLEDNTGTSKWSNADLLERNHAMLYPYYTLERVVGIDVGPQKSEPLTLVAFYKRYDGEIRLSVKHEKPSKELGPKVALKVPSERITGGRDQVGPVGHNGSGGQTESRKRRTNKPERPGGRKRPRRDTDPQTCIRDSISRSSSSRARRLLGLRGQPVNPWDASPSYIPMAQPDQSTSAVLSQLTSVIGKQLLLAQMNSAVPLTSGSPRPDRRAASYHGEAGPSQDYDDFPPPPQQLPTVLPCARDVSPHMPVNWRSIREGITRDSLTNPSREEIASDNSRRTGRQGFSRDDFWSTPLKDLTRSEFRSVSPRREHVRDSRVPWDAARSTTSREGSTREYHTNTNPELFLAASSTRDDDQSISPDPEDYFHPDSGRGSIDDTRRGVFRSAMRESVYQVRPRSPTEGNTWGDIRRSALDELTDDEFTNASREDLRTTVLDDASGRDLSTTWDDSRRAERNWDYFKRTTSDDPAPRNLRKRERDSPSREMPSYSGAVNDPFNHFDSREEFSRDDSRPAFEDFNRFASRRPWRDSGSSSSPVQEDFSNNFSGIAKEDVSRGVAEDYRSTAREDVSDVRLRDTPQSGLTRDIFFGTRDTRDISRGRLYSPGCSSMGAGDTSFRSGRSSTDGFRGDIGYPSSFRFRREGEDFTRRK